MTMPAELLSFIVLQADEADLERIIQSVKDRRRALANAAAAAVQVGATVTLHNISPKALAGLTGDVESINGKRADVLLTADSTNALRFSSTRFYVPAEDERYVLRGVPLTACRAA
jgi:hypothetical protein